MRELYLSELRHFRKAALIVAPLHLLGLFLVLRFRDIMHEHANSQALLLITYLVLAFGFGLYQFNTLRQPNRWIWLMHRPMPASHIAIAICGATATLIAAVIGLPGMLALAGVQLLTTRVVDGYHYAVVAHGTLFAISAWLCAGYVLLNRSKLGAAIVLLPFLLLFYITSIYQLLLMDLLCIALLTALVASAMKPNLHAAPRGKAAVLATALPLLLASYFVLAWGGSLAYQYATILHGSHPLNTEIPPAGGFTEAIRSESHTLMLQGLAASTHPRAAEWRRSVNQSNTRQRWIYLDRYPVRNQLAPFSAHSFDDPANMLQWTYSQDANAFIGRHVYTGQRKAVMPVPSLPYIEPVQGGGVHAVFPHSAVTYDPAAKNWREVLRVRNDEVLLGGPAAGTPDRQYIVTSKRLVVMDGGATLQETFGVPLPGDAADLANVDVSALPDGTLVSFLFGKRLIDGVPGGAQVILFVDAQGKAVEVARRPLTHDFAPLFEHKDWWVSPLLHAIDALPARLMESPNVFKPIPLNLPRPAAAWMAAALAAVLSALAGWAWLRRVDASPRRCAAWLAACLVFGPAAFLSLAVMEQRRARLPAAVPKEAAPLAA